MAYGIPGVSPNLISQQQRINALPSDPKETALAKYLIQLTQQNKVGTPEYFFAAGEFSNRQKVRQEQAAKQQQGPKVVENITAQAVQKAAPAMAMVAPITGGVGSLDAGSMERIDSPVYSGAMGGIVAFDDGGEVERFQNQGLVGQARVPSLTGAFSGSDVRSLPTRPITVGEVPVISEFGVPLDREAIKRSIRAINPNLTEGALNAQVDNIIAQAGRRNQPSLAPTTTAAAAAPITAPATTPAAATTTAAGQETPPLLPPPAAPRIGIESLRPIDYRELRNQAGATAQLFMGERPEALSQTEAVGAVKDVYKQAGVNFDLFKDQIKKLEDEGKAAKGDRQEAINMRLIEAGLGILGGESPYAFVNIGKGASPALKGLQDDFKDLKKIDRERQKAVRDLQVAENQLAAGVGKEAADRVEKSQTRIDNFNNAERQLMGSIFNTLTSTDTTRAVADLNARVQTRVAEATRLGAREDAMLRSARDLARREVEAMVRRSPLLASDPKFDFEGAVDSREKEILQRWNLEGRVSPVTRDTATGAGSLSRSSDGTLTYQPRSAQTR